MTSLGHRKLPDGSRVRILFDGEWYEGELQLLRLPACVFVDELGHVQLESGSGLPGQVDALEPLSEKVSE